MTTDGTNARTPSLSSPTDRMGVECGFEKRSAARTNVFVRHWRGDLSLGFSIWVNGMLALFGPRLLFAILIAASASLGEQSAAVLTVAWAWTTRRD